MNLSSFFSGLIVTILVSIGLYYLLIHFFPAFSYSDLNLIALLLFSVISLFVYYLAIKAAQSTNKYSFLNIVVMNLFIKVFASFLVVAIYVKLTNPEDKWYLIPFTMNYLIFTIFETYFLSKAAKVT